VPGVQGLIGELWNHLVSWAPFLLMAYASLAGIGHALEYAERVRHEQAEKAALETQLVDAQLGALRMQLQPHFLFNTLNGVAMLIRGRCAPPLRAPVSRCAHREPARRRWHDADHRRFSIAPEDECHRPTDASSSRLARRCARTRATR
jgi:hypothetical protein